jgi:hypothetical protein
VYRSFTCTHLAESYGRKFGLIRKRLGLSKGELARQHGISSSKSLQMLNEQEEAMTRIPKGRQGYSLRQKEGALIFC